jgi:hypothetical protein
MLEVCWHSFVFHFFPLIFCLLIKGVLKSSTILCLLQKSLQSLYLQKLELLAQAKADVADLGKEYQLLLDAYIQVSCSVKTS